MKKIPIDNFINEIEPILKANAKKAPKWYKKQLNHIQDARLKARLESYSQKG